MALSKAEQTKNKYADIIDHVYVKSTGRPHMSMIDRAAQFSPFAALTGHEDAIEETARLTGTRVELDEDMKIRLDEELQKIAANLSEKPMIKVTHFKEDERKEGGMYIHTTGRVRKLDFYEQTILLEEGTRIRLEDIIDILEMLQ